MRTDAPKEPIIKRLLQGLPDQGTREDKARAQAQRINAVNEYAYRVSSKATVLLAKGEDAKAEQLLSIALDQHPDMIPLRELLSEALIHQSKDVQAMSILLDLRDRQHVYGEGNAVRIALLRARLGQIRASRADWSPEIVMRYCEGLPEARASLPSVATPKGLETAWSLAAGYLTDLHGDTPGAAFYYDRVLALDPANVFVNLKMGDLELRTGKAASAVGRYALAAKGTGRLKETAIRQGATARSVAEASSKKRSQTEGLPPTSSVGTRR